MVTSRAVDATDTAQVDSWIKDTISASDKLHRAANIAGVTPPTPQMLPADTTEEFWEKIMNVNATGV